MKLHDAERVEVRDSLSRTRIASIYRFAVPGGWVYYTKHTAGSGASTSVSVAMTFVPDATTKIDLK